MASIFLSHSSKDKELARQIANDLRRQGVDVWLDEWEIRVGDSITQKISHGLDQMDLVAVLLTTNSIGSGWVEKEWQSKIGEEAADRKVLVLPIKGDACQIPRLLRDKRYADIQENYDVGLSDLLAAIRSHSPKTTATFLMIGFNVDFPTTWMSTLNLPVTSNIRLLTTGYMQLCRTTNMNGRVSMEYIGENVNAIGNPNHPILGELIALDWQTLSILPYDLPISEVKPPHIVLVLREKVSEAAVELKAFFMREPNIAEALSIWLNSDNRQGKCPIRFFYRADGNVRPEKVQTASL